MPNPRLTWINQAGCRIDSGPISLVFDPWIDGAVFDHGWELLVPSQMTPADFSSVTHIWFSHEHPDHFSPSLLGRIPTELRKIITILFRETDDKRVVQFCRSAGFEVLELANGIPYKLGDGCEIVCHAHGTIDSFLFVSIGGKTLLNVNDCIFVDENDRRKALDRYRGCDVLMCQFGFAEKIGNREDIEARRREGDFWIKALVEAVDIVRPTFTIPCANFKVFCRSDNAYMNEGAPTVDMAHERLSASGLTTPIVLSPGDVWDFAERDNTNSLNIYEAAWQNKSQRVHDVPEIPINDIKIANANFSVSIKAKNNHIAILFFSYLPRRFPFSIAPVSIWISDHGIGGNFGLLHGFVIDSSVTAQIAEIEIRSESLAFLLKEEFGISTCIINASFQSERAAQQRLFNMAHIRMLNSSGIKFGIRYIAGNISRAVKMILTRNARQRA